MKYYYSTVHDVVLTHSDMQKAAMGGTLVYVSSGLMNKGSILRKVCCQNVPFKKPVVLQRMNYSS